MEMFSPETYGNRRKELLKSMHAVGGCGIFLPNEVVSRNYKAEQYPFRQDSTFLYYFGISLPGIIGILDFDQGHAILVGDDPTIEDVIWTGSSPSMAELADKSGVKRVVSKSEMARQLIARKLHFLPHYQPGNQKQVLHWLKKDKYDQSCISHELNNLVIAQRSIKTAEELEQIESAITITKNIHVKVCMQAKPGKTEQEVLAEALHDMHSQGHELGYGAILTKHGEILHNHHHHHVLQEGDLLLADIGAESKMGYASDITRTFPVSSTFNSAQKAVYNIVLQALNSSIADCKPGVAYRDIHLNAARIITNGLKDMNIMNGSTDDIVHQGAHALFFPHGLGHMLGLDVHDMENLGEDSLGYDDKYQRSDQFGLSYLRLGKELQEGYVLTVEPGIYFIPALIKLWHNENRFAEHINYSALQDFLQFGGIRLEDNIFIDADGSRILGPPIPKTIEEVEFIKSA